MSVRSLSFWQQNQNWRIQQQAWSDQLATSNAVGSVLTTALTNQSSGLASIANHKALVRVSAQLKSATTAALQPILNSIGSTPASSGTSSNQVNKIA